MLTIIGSFEFPFQELALAYQVSSKRSTTLVNYSNNVDPFMEGTKGPRFPISNLTSNQFCLGIKREISEISDPQDVHMGWKKAEPLGALNMILGQIFIGLIPIQSLKFHCAAPTLSMKTSYCKSRRGIQPEVGVDLYSLQALLSKYPKRVKRTQHLSSKIKQLELGFLQLASVGFSFGSSLKKVFSRL